MKRDGLNLINEGGIKKLMLYNRWPWHLLFWLGYTIFRFWVYYITVTYYPRIFLEYMLLSELLFVCWAYLTLWMYRRFFLKKKYTLYLALGTISWAFYLYIKTVFQFWYLKNEKGFQGNSIADIFINNITVVLVYFLFITACKYFKDGYIRQYFEAERKEQQLTAEVNNLKSQIAPHFLFNTLNNLYGLAVDKSDKLPGLMLQLSHFLRHSLYETQKPLISINDELNVLKSYIEIESVRLEEDLKLKFTNNVPADSEYKVAPLILIVFIENAFKHAKFVRSEPVNINIETTLAGHWFTLTIANNYNESGKISENGIGLKNVQRRLELLYPAPKHSLTISKDDRFFTVKLHLHLQTDETANQ